MEKQKLRGNEWLHWGHPVASGLNPTWRGRLWADCEIQLPTQSNEEDPGTPPLPVWWASTMRNWSRLPWERPWESSACAKHFSECLCRLATESSSNSLITASSLKMRTPRHSRLKALTKIAESEWRSWDVGVPAPGPHLFLLFYTLIM